ncbi:MAG: hypothetical protein CMP65_00215 [Flavobacteriales bacterium]|nr:hypothetical protein [Flavobacteriales bacterium]
MKKIVFFYLFHLTTLYTFAQSFNYYENIYLKDYNYKLSIHENYYNYPQTVKIENTTNSLLDPIINLNSTETLKLSFDILADEYSPFAYTFIHCNANWEYSDLNQLEYLEGFSENFIENYNYSFNTLTNYIHYEFIFPNETVKFKKSGNYIVLVYDVEKNIPVITKRFLVHENIVNIEMDVKPAILPQNRETKQQIKLIISDYRSLNINDPAREIIINIQKNDNWNNLLKNIMPSFISDTKIEYDNPALMTFNGGDEFRDFDIKSLRYFGKNINSIETRYIQGSKIHLVDLYKDLILKYEDYKFKYDLNGKFTTSISEMKNKDLEADYSLVKFRLKTDKLIKKDIYIYGELTNWDTIPLAKMNFDLKHNEYYGYLFLKQGYYNYKYVTNQNNIVSSIENNFKETRNQYSAYVYVRILGSSYDRLVGIAKNNSNSLN